MTAEAQDVAEELALLTMLADRVAVEIKARRDIIADTWTGGSKVALELANPDNPERPIKVGTVRADGGQGVGRVADQVAWLQWVQRNVPTEATVAGQTSWALDDGSVDALAAAVTAGAAKFDPRSGAREALAALEAAGYTLTKRREIPAEVRPAWQTATLKATQEAGTPVCPDGQIPDGIEFVKAGSTVKPVVTIGKDETMREQYVAAHRERLMEITCRVAGQDGEQ